MFWIILIIIIVLIGLLYLVGHVFYEMVLNGKTDREFMTGPFVMDKTWQKNEAVFNTYHPQDLFLESGDGYRLHAIAAIQNPEKWVILVHGYMGRNAEMVDAALRFLEQGYSVLMPGHRAHGRSEGDTISMGINESQDIVSWIRYLTEKYPQSSIYLLGVSMGAASVMMAGGQDLPENVKAICEDCGYTSAWDEFSWQLKKIFHLPKFPVLYAADLVTRIRGKINIRKASPIQAVQKSKIPTLFLHGDADTFVPTHMVYKLYNFANYPKELCIIEGGEHAVSRFKDPEKYYSSVLNWFEKFQ